MLRAGAHSTLHGVVFVILCPGPAVDRRRGAALRPGHEIVSASRLRRIDSTPTHHALVRAIAPRPLLAPGRERVVEGALARCAFFDGDDGAALVDVDQRHVEPRALFQKLQIALAVGVHVRQADQEEAVGDLDRESRQRHAARLLVGFHQDARHVADAAAGEIRRQDEGQFRGVARGKRGVGVAAERHRHLELAVGNFDVGSHGDIGLLAGGSLDLFGAPDHRADILLALGIAGILVIQHHTLRHRRGLIRR